MKQNLIRMYLALAVLFSFIDFANGQESHKGNTSFFENSVIIGFTGGYSMPMGNYIKTDYYDLKSGFAGSGYNLGLSGTWFLDKHFGISALVSYHSFSFKGLQTIADSIHAAYAIDSSTVSSLGSNHTLNFLVGPYYSLPVNQKFSIDFRLLVGLVNAQLAGYEIFVEDKSASTFSQKISSAATIGSQLGVACRYNISKKLSVTFNMDYFYSKPNFKIEYDNRNNNAGRYLTTYTEAIAGINSNLTIAYRFLKM